MLNSNISSELNVAASQYAKEGEYWIKKLSGDPVKTNFPYDYAKDMEKGGLESMKFKLTGDLYDKLMWIINGRDHTLHMLLVTGVVILLNKYTGNRDIVVGMPIYKQEFEGEFINTVLALRNYIEQRMTFKELLLQVRQTILEANKNQNYPIETLLYRLDMPVSGKDFPLFDVVVLLENVHDRKYIQHINPNIIFSFNRASGAVEGVVEFNKRLYDSLSIERIIGHFTTLLQEALFYPDMKVLGIDILSPEEKQHQLMTFNNTRRPYPADKTIHRLIAEQVEKTPDYVALVGNEETRKGRRVEAKEHLSYRELDKKANQLANYLLKEKGVDTGEPVGILMDNSIHLVIAVLGILKSGAAYVPIDPGLPAGRLKHIIADARIGMVLSKKNYIAALNRLQWECASFHTFLCMDSPDILAEEELEKSELMDQKLWDYVAEIAQDEITGGGWNSSYTGQPFSKEEMDEYGDNALKKLTPFLKKNTRVMEIGCASGITMYRIAPKVGFYLGTDMSAKMIEKNKQRVKKEGHTNIVLAHVPAHHIDEIEHKNFDLVILNSVIQSFHGHNYLGKIIRKVIDLMGDHSCLFIGDVMDHDLKDDLVRDLLVFKQANRDRGTRTKTDFSTELFLSKGFFKDLSIEIREISQLEFSSKIHTLENELTKYRYDVLLGIDKTRAKPGIVDKKQKYQEDLRALQAYDTGKADPGVTPHHPAYVIYTSGTTGTPRGVIIEHRSLVNYAWWARKYYTGSENTNGTCGTFPLYSSISFDLTVTSIYLPLLTGNRIEIYRDDEKYSFPIERIVKEDRVDIIKATPSHLKLIQHDLPGNPSKLKKFIVGGEELECVLARDIYLGFSRQVEIYNEYGPTEATVGCMIYKYDYQRDQKRSVSIGLPVDNVTICILDDCMNPVPINGIGEIYIGGAALARGYLNQVELTAEKFHREQKRQKWTIIPGAGPYPETMKLNKSFCGVQGRFFQKKPLAAGGKKNHISQKLYRTGDLAQRLPNGNVEFLGRIDGQVKIRGYRIELKDIETQLLSHTDIKEAVVIARQAPVPSEENPRYERKIKDVVLSAYIVPHKEVEISRLIDHLSRRLPGYMIPSYFIPLERIPLTPNGKPDRRALPEPDIQSPGENYTAPGNITQVKLVEIWSHVLGIEKSSIGIDDNFFELGGHSLRATVVIAEMHKLFDVKVPLAEIFRTPFIRGLASYIDNAKKSIHESIKPVEKRDYYPQSSAQKRIFFLEQLENIGIAYNIPAVYQSRGSRRNERYKEAFNALIARHEALRTSFHLVNNEPVQKVHSAADVEFEIEYYDASPTEVKTAAREKTRGLASSTGESAVGSQQRVTNAIKNFIRPFDLAKAPLIRVGFIKISRENYLLLFDIHHIIGDGTSMGILVDDFIQLYDGEPLTPLQVHYRDFSLWQNNLFKTGQIEKQQEFWLNLYSPVDEIPRLNLPTDFIRPEVFSFAGERYNFKLGKTNAGKLTQLGVQHGVTLYMSLLAVFNVLLHKYSGQNDIIVGTGIMGRPHADLQKIIGMFVNSLALRNFPAPGKTYLDFLYEVKTAAVKAFENQDFQFEELVDRLDPVRALSRNPLFDVLMVVQNYEDPKKQMKDITMAPYPVESKISKFDLTLYAHEGAEDIFFGLVYCTTLFKKDTIVRLTTHFTNIIQQVTENPGIRLDQINLLTAGEKQQLLEGFNQTSTHYPGDKTIPGLFEEQVERAPDHIALVGKKEGGTSRRVESKKEFGGVHLSYSELNKKSNQLANYLHIKKNLQPGDRVGLLIERSLDMTAAIFGILKAGGAYTPIDPAFPHERIKDMIDDAEIGVMVSQEGYIETLRRLQKECACLHSLLSMDSGDVHGEAELEQRALECQDIVNPNTAVKPGDLAYIIYTSGSTGKPKGTLTTHRNVIRVVKETNYIHLTGDQRVLQLSNYAFDGSVFDIYGALLNGAALVILDKEEVREIDRLAMVIIKEKITVFFVTTALFNLLVDMRPDAFQYVGKVLFGGEQVSVEHARKALDYMGKGRIIHVYGPTETTVYATYYPLENIHEKMGTIPIGRPIANTRIYILDDALNPVPIGIPGEIYIGGDGVAKGYLKRPQLTGEKFIKSPFIEKDCLYRTGDLGKWLPGGDIIFIGRIDQQVKIRGFRVEPGEIESLLRSLDGISEAVVITNENQAGEKHLCAYVLPGPHHKKVDTARLKEILAARVPDYMVPAYIVPIDHIPLTVNGKIDRRKLPQPQMEAGRTIILPRNRLEEKLVEIWSEVLGIPGPIGIDDNFFELGGHSLKATVLVSRVRQIFKIEFPLIKVFSNPFIRAFSEYISTAKKSDYQEIHPVEKREYYPQSSAQKRLFFLDHFENIGTSYNSPYILQLRGNVDKERFKVVFQALIGRHEILRTSFHLIDNQPVQIVHDEVEFEIEYYDLYRTQVEVKVKVEEKEGTGRLAPLSKDPAASSPQPATALINSFIRPFDLSKAPLLRVGLIKSGEQAHILAVDMHHIITDGTSNAILVSDFVRLYEDEHLAALEVQYKDFSQWQNNLIETGKIKEQEEYWSNIFPNSEEVPKLIMPTDFPRPAVQGFEGASFQFNLGGENKSAFNRVALVHEATLFMNLLAALNVLLYKYTGQDDIIVGGAIAGRRRADLQHIIGMFVNALAIRSHPTGRKTYLEFLQEVKQNCINAYENQDVQFEDLVEKIKLERDLSRNPLFDVSLGVQNFETPLIKTKSELAVSSYKHKSTTSLFDLSLDVYEAPNDIRFRLEYSTKLFKKETIQRLIHHFLTIIGEVSQDPDTRISQINMLAKEEKQCLLFDFNDTHADYPLNKTVHQLFQEQVKRTPDHIAVVGPLQRKYRTYRTYITYKEINKKSNQLAHLLRSKGVGPDTAVGIMVEPSIEMVVGVLGILKAGGAYLPIDPGTPSQRLLSMLNHSDAPILLTKSQLAANHSFTALQDQVVTRMQPRITSPRERIVDMDRLPMMDRSIIDYNKYNKYIGYAGVKHTISLEATRGCPYNCIYCHKIFPSKQISRSAENIFAEVKYYYDLGVRRFSFSDDIFNLNIKNSSRFFEMIIKNGLNSNIHLFFSAGLRGDILTTDYIDLMVEAGTVCVAPALETASPRLQKVLGKNLNLKKFRHNVEYFCEKYPQVISELFTMHGFPTETKEEAWMTMDFIKSLKWIHFPYINILRIYSATKMATFAVKSGIPYESIVRSEDLAWHQLPDTLPISRSFTLEYQAEFLNEYFLCKERLLNVLPYQMRVMTEDEIVQKYDSYLPVDIDSFSRLLEFTGIKPEELGSRQFLPVESMEVPDLNEKIRNARGIDVLSPGADALRVLLLDLDLYFSHEANMLYDLVDEPLGLLRLITKLKQHFGSSINGKIAKSRIDFNCYEELKSLLDEFKPEVIGIRTLTFFRDFTHKIISLVRQWGFNAAIIVGGPHVTTNYHAVLQDKNIDLAVLGEGEITLVELIEKILENQGKLPGEEILEKIPGLAFIPGKRNQNAHVKLAREIIMLDAADAPGAVLSNVSEDNPPMINQPDDLAYVMFTSGTTGKPKGVLVGHGNVVNLLNWFGREYHLHPGTHVLQLTDYTFDPTVEDIFGTLIYGGTLHVVDKKIIWDPENFRRYVQLHQVNLIDFLPTGLKELLRGDKLESLRTVICGGERLEESTKNQIIKWGYRLYNHYGPTEITVDALVSACGPGAVNLGAPTANVKCYILDRDNMLAPIGVTGELCIGGAGLARGYLNNPELTAEKFKRAVISHSSIVISSSKLSTNDQCPMTNDRLYRTGDLARWLPEGTIEFSGRIDQQVKIRGHRIEPAEIQYFLLKHESINDAIVTAGTRGANENYLCAYIVTRAGLDISKLKEYLARQLPDYMIPAYFIKLERIPLTPTGKIDKKQLPPPGTEVGEGKKYAAPKSSQEKQIAAIWKSVLQLEKFSVHDNFFDIGGNSLNIVQVTNRINDTFGKRLSIMVMFKYPTIRSFAEFLLKEEKTGQVTVKKRSEALIRGKHDKKQRYQKRKNQAVSISSR
jgi:amino acid adenylation domain-containing protein